MSLGVSEVLARANLPKTPLRSMCDDLAVREKKRVSHESKCEYTPHRCRITPLPVKSEAKTSREVATDASGGIARRQRARRVAHRHLEGSSTLNDERATRRHVPGARTTNLVMRTSS